MEASKKYDDGAGLQRPAELPLVLGEGFLGGVFLHPVGSGIGLGPFPQLNNSGASVLLALDFLDYRQRLLRLHGFGGLLAHEFPESFFVVHTAPAEPTNNQISVKTVCCNQ